MIMATGTIESIPKYVYKNVPVPATTIDAGANAAVTIPLNDVAPSGYVGVGIIGAYSNYLSVIVTGFWVNQTSNSALIALRNNGSSAATISSGLLRVLFAKQ